MSAYINDPPNTETDYWVTKALLQSAGLYHVDPKKGVKLAPDRPDGYIFETKGPRIVASLAFCIAIMTLVTGLRLFLRYHVRRLEWGIDDTLMVPGLIMAVAYPALQIAMVQYGGAGKHMFDVTYENYHYYHWLALVAQIDFFVCIGVVKMSIVVFNMRLTSLVSRAWIIGNWSFFAIVSCYVVVAFFLNVFQCTPPAANFDYVVAGKMATAPKCLGVARMGTILRAINITLDYLLLAVPIIVLWKLKMSWGQKLQLGALFSVGAIACIGSAMTLVAKSRLKSDTLWNYTDLLAWSLVELVCSVLAASLPTLGNVFARGGGHGWGASGSYENHYTFGSSDYRASQYRSADGGIIIVGGGSGSGSSHGGFTGRSTKSRHDTHHLAGSPSSDVESDTMGIMRHDEIELTSEIDPTEQQQHRNPFRFSDSRTWSNSKSRLNECPDP
ncbi:uncharacterized protein IWZ02DRAFT_87030 [Phyllosticta citriasiana]|uniref:Rhodopsin domain-containing protein n=1 Tax=Phyllosticta citriasiana TaxID=595635 RepID=A0ABR1L1K2_9PEZI